MNGPNIQYIVYVGLPDQRVKGDEGVKAGITSKWETAWLKALECIAQGAQVLSITRNYTDNRRPPKCVFGFDIRMEGQKFEVPLN